jgi:hypothetical protein
MEEAARLAESLSEDGRYRLLIEAVTDYAIYMLPAGIVTSWNPGAPSIGQHAGAIPHRFLGHKEGHLC